MHRLPYVNRRIAISGKVGGAQQACRHARGEQLLIPGAVMVISHCARTITAEDRIDAFPHSLIGLPVTTCCEGITVFAVTFLFVQVPTAAAHALD